MSASGATGRSIDGVMVQRLLATLVVVTLALGACDADPPAPVAARPQPQPSLAGRVTDCDLGPLAGALVKAVPVPLAEDVPGLPDPRSPVTVTADAAGRYAFESLAAGDWDLVVSWDGAIDAEFATVRIPAVRTLDARLPPGCTVRGGVGDVATGRPLAGATVVLWDDRPLASAVTDASGSFELRTHRRACVGRYAMVTRGAKPWRPVAVSGEERGPLVLRDGDTQYLDRFDAGHGATLTGAVTGPKGPVAGAEVCVVVDGETFAGVSMPDHRTVTDAAGRYRIEGLAAGLAGVWVAAVGLGPRSDGALRILGGGMVASDSNCISLPADGDAVHDVALVPGVSLDDEELRRQGWRNIPRVTVRGRVTSPTGATVVAACVVLRHTPGLGGVWVTPASPWAVQECAAAVTGPDGAYEVELPDASLTYAVRAEAPGFAATTCGSLGGFDRDRSVTLDVVLDPGRALAGRVVRRGDRVPVVGALVASFEFVPSESESQPQRRLGGVAHAQTDSAGRFVLEHVPSRTRCVQVWGPGWVRKAQTFDETIAGEVVVEVEPSSTVEGVVETEDGTPAVLAEVVIVEPWAADGRGGSAVTRTDSQGRFTLRGLGSGPWNVQVRRDSSRPTEATAKCVPGGARDVRIVLPRR